MFSLVHDRSLVRTKSQKKLSPERFPAKKKKTEPVILKLVWNTPSDSKKSAFPGPVPNPCFSLEGRYCCRSPSWLALVSSLPLVAGANYVKER